MKSKFFLERLGIGYSIRLFEGLNIVGRAPNATVKISGKFGSRNHCHIIVDGESITLKDFSSNGTFVNEVEHKGTSTVLNENDKIGIGVHSIDEFLEDSIYHVYRLKKIDAETHPYDNVAEGDEEDQVITISEDESSEHEASVELLQQKNFEGEGSSNKIFEKSESKKKDVSNTSISEAKSSSSNVYNNEMKMVNNKNSELPNEPRVNQNNEMGNNNEICKTYKEHERIDNNGLKKSNTSEKDKSSSQKQKNGGEKEEDCDFLEFQSDELSQAIWDEIKQEIAELDLTEIENNDNIQNIESNLYATDVLDLTLDEDALKNEIDEELDPATRTWFMKLSQNFEETYEKKSNTNTVNVESVDDEDLYNKKKRKASEDSIKESLCEGSSPKEIGNIEKDLDSSLAKADAIQPKIDKKNVPIIDAPSLPLKRGRLRGVSADLPAPKPQKTPKKVVQIIKSPLNQSKSPRKNLRTHYSKNDCQSLKLQKKWLEKPNSIREKNKKTQIRDKRKEKLKELAEKNGSKNKSEGNLPKTTEKRKLSISIDNLDSEEKDKVLKKAKVKVTDKNRGAFLAEFSNDSASKIPNRRKSCDPSANHETVFSDALSSADRGLRKLNDTNKAINYQGKIIKGQDINKAGIRSSFEFKNSHKAQAKRNINPKSCIKSNDKVDSKNKKVKFNLKPTVFTYYIEAEENTENTDETSMKETNNKNVMKPDLSHFESRKRIWRLKCPRSAGFNTDHILSEILSWKPEWFDDREKANINGTSLLCPMLHSFKTLDDYQKTVFPLMKLELWERLLRDRKSFQNKYIQLNLQKFEIIEQIPTKRIICHCEYASSLPLNKPLFYSNELVFIKAVDKKNIFGHVIINRVLNANSSTVLKTYSVKIECNYNLNFLTDIKNAKVIQVQKVSVITTELGAFEAVKNLSCSPLLQKILNPLTLVGNIDVRTENQLKQYKYNGYDQLNDTQKNILMETYLRTINPSKDSVTLIEGPPGTGKSKLVTNLILQLEYGLELRHLDRKILVCAQSNVAVDVITQKLIRIRKKMESKKFRLVRYGVLDKMHPEVKPYSLTELIKLQKRSMKQTPELIALMDEKQLLEEKIKRLEIRRKSNSRDDNDLEKAKKDLNQINALLNENFNEIDRDLEYKFLANANIVCTTLSSCVRLLRHCNYFDVCIIDEATQCNEPWTLVPLQFGINSLILIGDTQQLPATTLSYLSKSYNYGKSYFTRAKEMIGIENRFIMSLKIQYRMHPEICQWPNSYFYRNRLINDEITTNFTPILKPYTIIELNFNQNKSTTSGIENCSEADFIVKLVQGLVDVMPVQKFSYGIITPYNLHCHNLREKLRKDKLEIEVNTIDSYQGKEKDIIIISNARTEGIGFLNEICRLNVALTRAKKCLILCGNFQHLSNINVWKSLLSDAKKRKLYFEPDQSDINDFKNKILKHLKV